MSEANTAVLWEFLDAYNTGHWDRLDRFVAEGYLHHSNDDALTLAQFKRGAAWIRAGIPDFHVEIEDIFGSGDRVAVRLVGRGTHLGSLYGEAASSRRITLHVISIYRLAEGLIAEDWEAMDEADLRKQVGAA